MKGIAKMKKKILLLITLLIFGLLVACTPSKPTNPTKLTNPTKQSEKLNEFVPDYALGKANTRGNTINMLQNKSCFAVQEKWIYYCYANNIYKMPIGGGKDDIYQLYSDKEVKAIQVMGDWIYFLENTDNEKWQISRIRTDGSVKKLIVEDKDIVTSHWKVGNVDKFSSFIAMEDWLYYMSSTYGSDDGGNNTITYHITRTKVDSTKNENIYSFEPQKTGNKSASSPLISYIDEQDTLYFYTLLGGVQRYFAIDINGGEPIELFSSLLQANNSNTVQFFFALDEKGNTYFTGYEFFDTDENDVKFKKDFAYPIYYLNGSLSSLANDVNPVPIDNGPGIDRNTSYHNLTFIGDQLVAISYDPQKQQVKSMNLYAMILCGEK